MPPAIEPFVEPAVSASARETDRARIADLRARIERIGGAGGTGWPRSRDALPLGIPQIDAVLPGGGLPRARLHEIVAADAGAAAIGFSAALLAGLAGGDGSVVWCRRDPGLYGVSLYGPGVAAFGLDPRRLLLVRARREIEVLWSMEESLRSGAVSAVLGEVTATVPPIASRRLQLAAEIGSVTGLLLRPPGAALAAGSATTRWRVTSASSLTLTPHGPLLLTGEGWGEDLRPPIRWRLELLRCPSAAPAGWLLDWCDETHRLRVAAELRDRPAISAEARPGRGAAV
jgi:protein ImuA